MPKNHHLATLSANELVSRNLRRARLLRGLTQEQAVERLEPFLGRRLSEASYSAIERSHTGERRKRFDADELIAYARAFELPLGYFLLPVGADDTYALAAPGSSAEPLGADAVIDLLFALDADSANRLAEIYDYPGLHAELDALERIEHAAVKARHNAERREEQLRARVDALRERNATGNDR